MIPHDEVDSLENDIMWAASGCEFCVQCRPQAQALARLLGRTLMILDKLRTFKEAMQWQSPIVPRVR